MLEQLKAKNTGLQLFFVDSKEFRSYGRILTDLDTTQILVATQVIQNPESGASYVPAAQVAHLSRGNQTLIDCGVVSGITGCNHRIAY